MGKENEIHFIFPVTKDGLLATSGCSFCEVNSFIGNIDPNKVTCKDCLQTIEQLFMKGKLPGYGAHIGYLGTNKGEYVKGFKEKGKDV